MSKRLEVNYAGVHFKNPVALASGTCGFGKEMSEYFDIQRLGGLCSKGLTLHPRGGNDGIRVWETPSGVMNSVGLENPGVKHFIECDAKRMNALDLVNIVNLGGHSMEDYLEAVELLNGCELDLLELNISCPNVKAGGMNFGVKTELARQVVREIRKVCKHKLVIKLSPNAVRKRARTAYLLPTRFLRWRLISNGASLCLTMCMPGFPVLQSSLSPCAWYTRLHMLLRFRLWESVVLQHGRMQSNLLWRERQHFR